MGRTLAVVLHALASVVAGALYFFFVLPRWWELNGDITSTWGMVLRIVTGVVIGLAALPVVFTWLRTRRPEYGTPQLALRLRICSIVLHIVCAVLIIGIAISEIWLSLDNFGEWLFGVYGAAAAIGVLGIFSFYLAFIAELPPPPPRPLKKERKSRRRRGKDDAGEEETAEAETSEEPKEEDEISAKPSGDDETEEAQKPMTVGEADETVESETPAEGSAADERTSTDKETSDEEAAAADTVAAEAPRGRLRNRRPSGKIRRPRMLRKSDGVPVDD